MCKMRFVPALCLLLLISCAGQALLTRPAGECNLTAADLGAGYTMTKDEALETFAQDMDSASTDDIRDASFRTFEADSGTQVLAMVVTLKGVATADNLAVLSAGFAKGLSENLDGVAFEERDAPLLGAEAVLRSVEIADMDTAYYFLSFRQSNGIGIIAVAGPPEAATVQLTTEFGQKLLAKFQ